MTLEIRKPYTQIRVQTVPEGESLTEQSHKKKVSSKMFDIKKWEKQQYKEWKPSDARRY